MEKTLIILRGIPGCGKSTIAELLSENGKYPIACADDYHMVNGEYIWKAENIKASHAACQDKVAMEMILGTPKIFVANTNTTESEMEPYFILAKEFNYKVVTLIVENRHGNSNVHNVPQETIKKMTNRFEIKLI